MHYRQRIRDALASALTGQTSAGTNVFTSRARPILEILQRKESVLSVYTADESSERNGTGYLLDRKLQVTVEGMMGGGDDLDDQLDLLAQQVEAVIDADPTLGNLLSEDLVLAATATEISARGNMQVGAFRLDFECSYQTERIVEQPLPGFPPQEVIVGVRPVDDAYLQQASEASGLPIVGVDLDDPAERPALENAPVTPLVTEPVGPIIGCAP